MRLPPVLVAFSLLVIVLAAAPENAAGGEEDSIGWYERLLFDGTLTEEHVNRADDAIKVAAPAGAKRVAVDTDFLGSELGYWSADVQFTTSKGKAVFDKGEVTFRPFTPSDVAQFTRGSPESIHFDERPMWIMMESNENGVMLHMEDGNKEGQQITMSKSWLYQHGFGYPVLQHEDGRELPIRENAEGTHFVVDVPHFSWTLITFELSEEVLKGKRNGVFVPHTGNVWWNETSESMKIETPQEVTTYQIWIEETWIEQKINWLSLRAHTWEVKSDEGKQWYVVTLDANQTGAGKSLIYERYFPSAEPTYTRGNPSSVLLSDLDVLSITESASPSEISISTDHSANQATIDRDYLDAMTLTEPSFVDPFLRPAPYLSTASGYILPLNGTTVLIGSAESTRNETQLVNVSSLRGILDTGTFQLELFGESHSFTVTVQASNVTWEDLTSNNTTGTIPWERFIFYNATQDHVIGYATLSPIGISMWIQGNASESRDSIAIAPTGRQIELPVGSFEEVNIKRSLPPPHFTRLLAQPLKYAIAYDESAASVIMGRYMNDDPRSLCTRYLYLYPITTFAYDHAGVNLSPGGCYYVGADGLAPADSGICDYADGLHDLAATRRDVADLFVGITASENTTVRNNTANSRGCAPNRGPLYPHGHPDDYSSDIPRRYAAISIRESRYELDKYQPEFEHAVGIVWQHEVGHLLSLEHENILVNCEYPSAMYPARGLSPMGDYDSQYAFTDLYCPQFEAPPDADRATVSWFQYESSRVQMSSTIYGTDDEHWW